VKNKILAEQILYLANSLGLYVNYTIKDGVYRIKIKGNLKSLPCKKYKAHNMKGKCTFKIEEYGEGEYYGCMVDGDNKMLLKNFVVTHNSYFTAQKIIYKMVTEKGHRFLVARKVKKEVKHSCYDLLVQTIRNFGMTDLFSFNNTEASIKCKVTDNAIFSVGLDDVTKLKSFFDPTDFWLEEADQAVPDDVNQLRLRLRGNTTFVKQGILTLNPIWAGHWIKKTYFDEPKRGVTLHHSTYRDNRFLQEDVVRYLESITDSYYKDVYVDGNWGVYGGVVFSDYIIEDLDYSLDSYENLFMGMDFGYNHASALILGGFRDGELYVIDELYGKGWTNLQFIMNAEEYYGDLGHSMIIKADSAEPDRIDEWNSRGWHVEGATKGMGSLRFGIDFLTRQRMHIDKTKCPNTAKEIQIFHRKKIRDKDGNEEYTDDFVEVNDDCIAALRYGTEELWHAEVYSGFISNYSLSDLGL
jgi:phage terminase large subunit